MIRRKRNDLQYLGILGTFAVFTLMTYLTLFRDGEVSTQSLDRLEANLIHKIRELGKRSIPENLSVHHLHSIPVGSVPKNQPNSQMHMELQNGANPETTTQFESVNQHPDIPKCEVIQVAFVCSSYNVTRDIVTLIKSVLFYRKNPLQFHFISNSISKTILSYLFKTWNLSEVEVSFYSIDSAKEDVEWIKAKGSSGNYGLVKLVIPKLLPASVRKVIVLDADTTFASDIAELWKVFTVLTNQALGLVENQNDWYLGKSGKNHQVWPALGRGFNTGVMLMNLDMLRAMEWMTMWRQVAEEQLLVTLFTELAEQDIINSVLKQHPDLVKTLPCQWNLQLGDNTSSEQCNSEITDLKIIHWTLSQKLKIKHKHIDYFYNLYQTFLEYDGNLLRRKLFGCETENTVDPQQISATNEDDECYDFRQGRDIVHRAHLYYLDYKYTPVKNDVTFVGQLSMDRLHMLETICKHWNGPISLVVYVTDAEAHQFLQYAQTSAVLRQRRNIGYHVVYKDGKHYPVNHLRNLALQHIQTDYMFLSDIDFLPNFSLRSYLKEYLSKAELSKKKKALIVPAFETQKYKFRYPRNKTVLLNLLESGELFTFKQEVWPAGHNVTDYKKWKNATKPYTVKWKPRYEPYIVVSKNIPLFDQRFLGYGWNKVSHIIQLDADGYEFVVLPNAYTIHMPHAPSIADATFKNTNSVFRRCIDILKAEFRGELTTKYGVNALKYLENA